MHNPTPPPKKPQKKKKKNCPYLRLQTHNWKDEQIIQFSIVTNRNTFVCNHPRRKYLAALPEEVKQIITDAFTLMAART